MKYQKIGTRDYKQVGMSSDQKDFIYTNGMQYVSVPIRLVHNLEKDAYDLGVEAGKKLERNAA